MRRGFAGLGILLASVLVADAAQACRGWVWEQSLFVAPPLAGIEAELIVEVTITEIVPADGLGLPPGIEERHYQAALARVRKVVRGNLDTEIVTIVNLPSSCGPHLNKLSIDQTGLVAGKIGRGRRGTPLLFARGESSSQRDRRLGLR